MPTVSGIHVLFYLTHSVKDTFALVLRGQTSSLAMVNPTFFHVVNYPKFKEGSGIIHHMYAVLKSTESVGFHMILCAPPGFRNLRNVL